LAPRHALVHLDPPILLTDHLKAYTTKARPALRELTSLFENAVQNGLDTINADNSLPGGELFAATPAES
jgi:hypothetical protein